MSEVINNREYRQRVLKELIQQLHQGKPVEEVKTKFAETFDGVSTEEIAQLEQALMQEGMAVEEIQRLCDVHAAFFKGSIQDIHKSSKLEDIPGHPLHIFKLENRAVEELMKRMKQHLNAFRQSDNDEQIHLLQDDVNLLFDLDKHYSRKENLLFPYMEQYGITAPPKVMWGVDDEIREAIKELKSLLSQYKGDKERIIGTVETVHAKVAEMIFKEEQILFPMVAETLAEKEWLEIAEGSEEIGYCLIEVQGKWTPVRENVEQNELEKGVPPAHGYLKFDTGVLTLREISLIFNHLPFDLTFVDKDGTVKYFSQGKDRIFPRTKAVIGRKVANCHPPASVHIVEKLVADFQSGRKDHEDFWIQMGDRYVYIRYFAIRDEKGEYAGTLEVTQDIQPIQKITGEKRLVAAE